MAEDTRLTSRAFLQGRLARRIFLYFMICAALPVAVLAAIVFVQVRHEMRQQSRTYLDREVKSLSMGLYERLLFAEKDLEVLAGRCRERIEGNGAIDAPGLDKGLAHRFKAAALFSESGEVKALFGKPEPMQPPTPAQKLHAGSGGSFLRAMPSDGPFMRIFFARLIADGRLQSGWLYAETDPTYLWKEYLTEILPYATDVCLFDALGRTLYSTFSFPAELHRKVSAGLNTADRGHFELEIEGEACTAAYWTLFLEPRFLAPKWTVVLVHQKAEFFEALDDFKIVFPLIIAAALGSVVLLSTNLIRRSLIPLKSLIRGTQQVAQKDFSRRIEVASGDEFGDLAQAFNDMSGQLSRQFKIITSSAEVDRAILSSLDTAHIVEAIIRGIGEIMACDHIGVGILEFDGSGRMKTYNRSADSDADVFLSAKTFDVEPARFQAFFQNSRHAHLFEQESRPGLLHPFMAPGIRSCAVLPVFLKEHLAALIFLGFHRRDAAAGEDINPVRQLADQMAVALANSKLVADLDRLNWGTLKALARAVDAKSAWTAGHSEEVTALALKIGRTLGLDKPELDRLHRGALLHDIGKIGVPAVILDKPGQLTYTEYRIMKYHPEIGARILSPIAEYQNVIPIVLQHHERPDGKGYPQGLTADQIDPAARILAVADVYDAMKSDRPYRKGWPQEKVLAVIKKEAGEQFDVEVVEALFQTIKKTAADRGPGAAAPEAGVDQTAAL